ncbi:MAG: Coenzyme F420 hydrogenase/dehydrogenase, beta subunit C-terminal domain [Clostridiales bacterium]|nr:Coenzyme F420 hydrogenase/dehydrogenase, beta subunit C-terminal domain [Clostridiales bacterium]
MKRGRHGFDYPKSLDCSKQESCGLCKKVCPQRTDATDQSTIYVARAIDDDEMMHSSSGAVFALLAKNCIDCGGVVFGAGMDASFKIAHRVATTSDDLHQLRGSKYVQSDIGDCYRQARGFLKLGKSVLFSGTPCQIAGLKSFLGKPLCDDPNLLAVDVICHGVASPGIWNEYVTGQKLKEKRFGKLEEIVFRFKDINSSEDSYRFRFRFRSRSLYRHSRKDYFYQLFLRYFTLRDSCYSCDFRGASRSWCDISLGDYPTPQALVPDVSSPLGVNIVLVHSQKGEDSLRNIKDKLVLREVAVDEMIAVLKINTAIELNHERPKEYDRFWRVWSEYGYEKAKSIALPTAAIIKLGISDLCKVIGIHSSAKKLYSVVKKCNLKFRQDAEYHNSD